MMYTLELARDQLALIPGVVSCKVGIEPNISPNDYPLIRVVPTRVVPGRPYNNRTAECLIYFGTPLTNAEGLEQVYRDLFALEEQIISTLHGRFGRYIETITDEDRMDTYKLMAIRCELRTVDHVLVPVAVSAETDTALAL